MAGKHIPMRLIPLLAAVLLTLGLAGCFSDPVQDDLLNYLNVQSPSLVDKEDRIFSDYGSVAGTNYTDDTTMYDKLTKDVIPDMKDLIKELENLKLDTTEVKNVHQKWIDAAKMQLKGFEALKTALEQQSTAGVDQANEYFDKATSMYGDHETAIENLAKDHNVELTRK